MRVPQTISAGQVSLLDLDIISIWDYWIIRRRFIFALFVLKDKSSSWYLKVNVRFKSCLILLDIYKAYEGLYTLLDLFLVFRRAF